MKLHLGEAWGVLLKTLPCVFVRLIIYGVVAICAAIYVGVLLLMAKVFGGAGGILVLFLIPFIDKSPEKRPGKRPLAMTLMVLTVAAIIALTLIGIFS